MRCPSHLLTKCKPTQPLNVSIDNKSFLDSAQMRSPPEHSKIDRLGDNSLQRIVAMFWQFVQKRDHGAFDVKSLINCWFRTQARFDLQQFKAHIRLCLGPCLDQGVADCRVAALHPLPKPSLRNFDPRRVLVWPVDVPLGWRALASFRRARQGVAVDCCHGEGDAIGMFEARVYDSHQIFHVFYVRRDWNGGRIIFQFLGQQNGLKLLTDAFPQNVVGWDQLGYAYHGDADVMKKPRKNKGCSDKPDIEKTYQVPGVRYYKIQLSMYFTHEYANAMT